MQADLQKAATLLASIPESDSAALLNRLSPDQMELLSQAVKSLASVSSREQSELVDELIERRYDARQETPIELARNVASARVNSALQPEEQQALEHLQAAPHVWLAEQLTREMPQTIAVVIRHLPPDLAARTLACLATETQIHVVRRLANSERVNHQAASEIIATLVHRLREDRLEEINCQGGLALVAQIVARLDHATEKALLENLAQDDRDMVDQLLRLKFVLRDRQRICDKARAA